MRLRPILFWSHLVAGLVAGLVIAVMSFTGAMLAFEKEIIAWAERDVRRVAPSPDGRRLGLDALLARVKESQPGVNPGSVTLRRDPTEALLVSINRTNNLSVNPYTSEIHPQGAPATRQFMRLMMDWHRWLGQADQRRPLGKAITGASNAAFLVLALTGLVLWWPRKLSAAAFRSVTLMNLKLRGKARDWNWHNVVGVWCAPVLIVLTITALPMSYRWANDLVYKMTGNTPPAPNSPPGGANPAVEVPKPAPGSDRMSLARLVEVAQEQIPQWQEITIRFGGGNPREGGGRNGGEQKNTRPHGPQPVSIAVKERSAWPRFGATQLSLDPYTGSVLRVERYSDWNLGRRIRSWTRFLHTGEALGWAGQVVAGLASLGGVLLTYTGFALAWRRLVWRSAKPECSASPVLTEPAVPARE